MARYKWIAVSSGAAILGTEIGEAQRVLNSLFSAAPIEEASAGEMPREVAAVTTRLMK